MIPFKNILVSIILAAALLAGCSQPTDEDSGGGGSGGLADVRDLSGTVDHQSITLSWTNPDARLLYKIEITGEPNITTVTKTNLADYTQTFTGLTNNESYTFTVKAVYYPGEDIDKSPGATITLVPNTHDATGLSVIPGNGRVSLKWTDPTFADLDRLEITWAGENGETGGPKTVAGGLLTTAITGLTNEIRYTFTLRAADTANNGSAGVSITAIPSTAAMWNPADSAFGTSAVNHAAWGGPEGNKKFVAVGAAGKIAWSPDGKTWKAVPEEIGQSRFDTAAVNGVAWGGPAGSEKFVAVGASGKMAWSANGINWTAIPAGTGNATTATFGTTDINGIAWGGPEGNEKFVAVGASGKMAYSSDGITWTAIAAGTGIGQSSFGTSAINRVAWGGGKVVAVGASGKIATSTDGTTWTAVTDTPFLTGAIKDIAWGNGKFVAVSAGVIAWSTDGSSWTQVGPTSGYTLNAVAWGGAAGSFTVVANTGYILAFE
jgi:hypothetical protein